MTKLSQRFFTMMLCLCLLAAAAPSRTEEASAEGEYGISNEEADMSDEEYLLAARFGLDTKVETDENGEPVSVNGYPTRLVRAGFNNLGQ